MKTQFVLFVFTAATALLGAAPAAANVDLGAPVILLRSSCDNGANPPGVLDNCFITMSDALTWAYAVRHPSALSPLIIDVGPGSFGGFTCGTAGVPSAPGYITVRGSGRHTTVLGASEVHGCQQLAFQDLSIVNGGSTGNGFTWWYEGSASFSNVEITGPSYAWWDITYTVPSTHYWWNSVLNGSGAAAYQTYGAVHRFYGGEINHNAMSNNTAAVWVNSAANQPGEIQMYGSAIRARAHPGANVTQLTGVRVDVGHAFHLHGGSIGVDAAAASATAVNVTGIRTQYDAEYDYASTVHVLETAFALKPKGTGTATRLTGTTPPGKGVESVFLWSNGPSAPPVNISQKGADMYVETDCSAAKCSSAAAGDGTETHLLIYNNSCTTDGPWFDTVTGRCRGL